MVVRRLPADSELYHHGIKGQRWGIRRFQNRDGSLTSAGRKHKGLIDQIRDNRRMKKVRMAKVEKAKQQQKLKEERTKRLQQAAAERKARGEVIKTGNAKDIQKFQHKMSDKEYEKALSRIDLNRRLNEAVADQAKARSEKMQARLNTVMNVAKTAADIADSASKVYNALEKVGVVKKNDAATGFDAKLSKKEKEARYEKAKADIAKAKSDVFKNETYVKTKGKTDSVSNADIDEIKKMLKEMNDRM